MKNLHLLLLLTFPLFLQAQITLTADDIPQAGDVLSSVNCNVPPGFSIGSPGANQTYNLSQLTPVDTTNVNFVAPGGTAGSSEFPNASLAVEDEGDFVYYQQTSNEFLLLGVYVDTSANNTGEYEALHFNPADKIFEIPSTYLTNWINVSEFSLTQVDQSGYADSTRLTSTTENNVLFDGYGTVITPNGSFDGLRERNISTFTTDIESYAFGVWVLVFTQTTIDTSYNWYSDNNVGLASASIENGVVTDVSYSAEGVVMSAPVANFSSSDLGAGLISFTDLSSNNPSSWAWDFGDGNTSTQQNPQHTYAAPGTYTVCLTATNSTGSNTVCMMVVVSLAPVADFTFTDQTGGVIDFMDESVNNPTSWVWDFGDGNTSTQQNPQHTYAAPGTYTVCLTATNSTGSNTVCMDVTISLAPVAAFSFTDQSAGVVDFMDESINNPTSWSWDFGDGNTSTDQNPQHTYNTPGTYNVCLTVTNATGSDMACLDVSIVLAPVAAFTFTDQTQGVVDFTDGSSNNPTSWSWDFGDGNTSTDQNPQHTYSTPGTYNVCLTATNSAGSNTVCEDVDVMITGVNDLLESFNVAIFPNPARSIINVQLENQTREVLDFQLMNTLGQAVLNMEMETKSSYLVGVENLSSGVYFYTFKDSNGVIRKRGSIVKEGF